MVETTLFREFMEQFYNKEDLFLFGFILSGISLYFMEEGLTKLITLSFWFVFILIIVAQIYNPYSYYMRRFGK